MEQIERSTTTPAYIGKLLLAGFTFTLVNTITKEWFTYKTDYDGYATTIAVRANKHKFPILGKIELSNFNMIPASYSEFLFKKELYMIRVFWWGIINLETTNIEFWHPCKCRRCKRLLTDPRSIEKGIGPGCEKKENKGDKTL